MDDTALLSSFRKSGDEAAFRTLVERHIGLVYGAARRQVRDAHMAEDVTQKVFIALVKKMGSLGAHASIAGWLIATTHFICRDMMKAEARRRRRETIAARELENMKSETPAGDELSPLLDDGLSRLSEPERSAVAMRYLQGRSVAEVAGALNISTDAAQKRISRGIEHLRESFSRRGIVMSVDALTAAIAAHAVHDVPANLASSTVAAGISTKASVGVIAMMSVKAKLAVTSAAVLLLLVGIGTYALQRGDHSAGAKALVASNRLKLGYIISQYTATGPCWTRNRPQFGYLRAREGLNLFNDRGIDVYAIIEPDTDRSGEIASILRRFPADHVINGADAAALQKLDVIASYFQWNIQPEVLKAVNEAVKNGVGFYFQTTAGSYFPGYIPEVQELQGIHHAQRYYRYIEETPVKIVGDHPLLAELKNVADHTLMMPAVSGSIGEIAGTALMESHGENMLSRSQQEAEETETWDPPASAPTAFYPLYISRIGKGRIVAVQWESAGKQFEDLTHHRFPIHCAQWLANRPLD